MTRVWLMIVVALIASPVFAKIPRHATQNHSYNMADRRLKLAVPAGWKEKTRKTLDYDSVSVGFSPAHGAPFRVWLSASVVPEQERVSDLRGMLEAKAQMIRPRASEAGLSYDEISAGGVRGYYFRAAEPTARRGEYKFLTHGIVTVGDGSTKVEFSILTNDGQQDAAKQALEMIRTIAVKTF